VFHRHKRPRCRAREVHFLIWEKVSTLETIHQLQQEQLADNICESPCTPESTTISALVSGTDDDSRQCSREASTRASSTRTSLSSADNIPAHSGGKRPIPPNQLSVSQHNSRDVKGLRNISRYEPYISRRLRKPKAVVKVDSNIVATQDSGSSVANTPSESGIVDEIPTVPICDDNSKIETDITTSPGHSAASMPNSGIVSTKQVSLDVLKGILSEELDLFDNHIVFSGERVEGSFKDNVSDDMAGEEEERNIFKELFE